jgi:hypothetical protein
MKIVVGLMTGSNNTERTVLRAFYQGLKKFYFDQYQVNNLADLNQKHNIEILLSYDLDYPACNIGVQFGTVKDRKAEHHIAKQNLQKSAEMLVFIETPILGRVIDNKNNYSQYRIGVDGFLNNQGLFFSEKNLQSSRLDFLLEHDMIKPFPGWKNHQKGNILILSQLLGDSSLRGQKISEWLLDAIDTIRSATNRSITIRLHPSMSQQARAELCSELGIILLKNYQNIHWSSGTETTLQQDLARAGICVTYSSGSAVDAILAGVPVIALDEGNFAYEISSIDLDDIDSPKLANDNEIERWLTQLANSQWSKKEMYSGEVWRSIESLLKEKVQ